MCLMLSSVSSVWLAFADERPNWIITICTHLSRQQMNDLKCMFHDCDSHQFLAIVTPMHHHGVYQTFHNGTLHNTINKNENFLNWQADWPLQLWWHHVNLMVNYSPSHIVLMLWLVNFAGSIPLYGLLNLKVATWLQPVPLPPTVLVQDPYCKLQTKFFPLIYGLHAWAINQCTASDWKRGCRSP